MVSVSQYDINSASCKEEEKTSKKWRILVICSHASSAAYPLGSCSLVIVAPREMQLSRTPLLFVRVKVSCNLPAILVST